MPTAAEILDGLRSISNNYTMVSIYWHIVIYIAIVIILIGVWRPSNRMAGMFLSLPFFTVALLAWFNGNPFNGILFSILAIFCLIPGFRLSKERINYSSLFYRIAGVLLLLFGLWYPHFLEADSYLKYLYAAPTGLIPCPTLSIAIGIALIYNGFNSNPLKIILICFGFFYGLFGILKLGVYLDAVLLLGTIILLFQYFYKRK
jgi:hypothetical protein